MPLTNGNPEHLTVEELAVIEATARQYAKKAAHKESQSVLRRYVVRASIAFILLGVGLAIAFGIQQHDAQDARNEAATQRQAIVRSGRLISVTGCNRDFVTISALRGILIRGTATIDQAEKTGRISSTQAEQARKFYQESLDSLVLPDCRKALKVVTDDPSKIGVIPEPLYVKPKE